MSKKPRLLLMFLGVLVNLYLVLATNSSTSNAQSALQWSVPQRMPGSLDDTDPPYLLADQNRTVHAFFSQWIEQELAVYYSQWTLARGWTPPIDILLSPNAHQATVTGAYLDSKGMVHIVFYGGTAQGAEIYYSSAEATHAGQAHAWAQPQVIGASASSPVSAALVGNDGILVVLYSGNLDGSGVYEVHSVDGGDTWSGPRSIFPTNANLAVYSIHAAMDSQRRVHAVWDVRNRQGLGEAVYYAMLESDHEQWSQPITLQTTKGGDYQAAWPSIVINKDELFVMYDYEFPPTRWMRRSRDGGQTWTSPIAPFAFLVGETGAPVFLNDSSNTLHLFFSMRTRDTTIGGLFHSQWLGSQWSAVDGIQTAAANSREVAPSRPAGVVSQGNVLLAAWRKDPALPGNGIWYSYVTVNSPELPLEALPTRDAKPTAAPTRVLPQPTAVNQHVNPLPDRDANLPTSSPQDSSDVSAQGVGQSQTSFIIWAAAFPVLAMIGFIVLMHARDRLRY